MRLYDWMLHPDNVCVVEQDGVTYASDRYVLMDCRFISDKTIPEPGFYKIRATRPGVVLDDFDQESAKQIDLRGKLAPIVESFTTEPSLDGTPVGMNAKFLAGLPDNYVIIANDPVKRPQDQRHKAAAHRTRHADPGRRAAASRRLPLP